MNQVSPCKRILPNLLTRAIEDGTWRDPGPKKLGWLLGGKLDLPPLELYESVETMQSVIAQVEDAGFVDDPEFCMLRAPALADPRLVFGRAWFIGGCRMPGDDVLIAIECEDEPADPRVRVFDWDSPVPQRWRDVGALSNFIRRLSGDDAAKGPAPR